jgi:hypothetical protein
MQNKTTQRTGPLSNPDVSDGNVLNYQSVVKQCRSFVPHLAVVYIYNGHLQIRPYNINGRKEVKGQNTNISR